MPDVILYNKVNDLIYFIEVVVSSSVMEPKRIKEIQEMAKNVMSRKIYITAFSDFKKFKKFCDTIAWETKVWIAQKPNHVIHFN